MLLDVVRCVREDKPRTLMVALVYASLLLDNMLLTVVVPIVPDYLLTSEGVVLAPPPTSPFPLTAAIYNKSTGTSADSVFRCPGNNATRGCLSTKSAVARGVFRESDVVYNVLRSGPVVNRSRVDEDQDQEAGRVGLLLSSKAVVQLLVNPAVGAWITTAGTRTPLLAGSICLLLAALLFALGEAYSALFAARSLQGIASACIGVSGMCLVAELFPEEGERSRALGVVLGAIALGVLLGYPLGGFLYHFIDKTAPFLVIAALALLLAVVQLMLFDIKPSSQVHPLGSPMPSRWKALLSDRAILLSAGAILISSSSLAILEPYLPVWLKSSMKPEKWQLGTVFLPDSIGYLLGAHLLGEPALRLGRWRVAAAALLLLGFSAALVCSASSLWQLTLPHFGLGLGVGAVDAALVPLLAYLVDCRHGAGYGAVYTLQQAAVSMAYALGPLVGGLLVRSVGFPWLMRGMGALNILYCPLMALLAQLADPDDPDQLPQRRRSLVGQTVVNYQTDSGHRSKDGCRDPSRPAYVRFGDSDDSD